MGVRLKRLKMVSTYIWVDTIAPSDGVRKVCCPDGYSAVARAIVRQSSEQATSLPRHFGEAASRSSCPADASTVRFWQYAASR
ncbi:hypothetical protein CBI55_07000 [Pseudomonas syringae]|nr:hypothetical protein CBI55_07000 [Pseudomonas syringae]